MRGIIIIIIRVAASPFLESLRWTSRCFRPPGRLQINRRVFGPGKAKRNRPRMLLQDATNNKWLQRAAAAAADGEEDAAGSWTMSAGRWRTRSRSCCCCCCPPPSRRFLLLATLGLGGGGGGGGSHLCFVWRQAEDQGAAGGYSTEALGRRTTSCWRTSRGREGITQ